MYKEIHLCDVKQHKDQNSGGVCNWAWPFLSPLYAINKTKII